MHLLFLIVIRTLTRTWALLPAVTVAACNQVSVCSGREVSVSACGQVCATVAAADSRSSCPPPREPLRFSKK
ncbi:hypothetical protein [Methanimicrococcus hongohii]|uniref:hypothetical protein n=1 Tax=Methanimicrococcus hongohii TaxID=3028295 RepID=UPI00292E3622|nr:hypothetical protein [Methanimicrococcus sp. Hf6]